MAGNTMKPCDKQMSRGEFACQPVMTVSLATYTVSGDPAVEVTSVNSPINFTSGMYLCDTDGDGLQDSLGLIATIPAGAVSARFLNIDGAGSLPIILGSISSSGAWVAKSGGITLPAAAGAGVILNLAGCVDSAGDFPTCMYLNDTGLLAQIAFLFECATVDGA